MKRAMLLLMVGLLPQHNSGAVRSADEPQRPCVPTEPMPVLKPPARFVDSMPVLRPDSTGRLPMHIVVVKPCYQIDTATIRSFTVDTFRLRRP